MSRSRILVLGVGLVATALVAYMLDVWKELPITDDTPTTEGRAEKTRRLLGDQPMKKEKNKDKDTVFHKEEKVGAKDKKPEEKKAEVSKLEDKKPEKKQDKKPEEKKTEVSKLEDKKPEKKQDKKLEEKKAEVSKLEDKKPEKKQDKKLEEKKAKVTKLEDKKPEKKKACPANCDACTDNTACTACSSGYFWDGTACQAFGCVTAGAGIGCKTCVAQAKRTSNHTCASCSGGYFLEHSGICKAFGCTTRDFGSGCKTCVTQASRTSDSTCASCNDDYWEEAGSCKASTRWLVTYDFAEWYVHLKTKQVGGYLDFNTTLEVTEKRRLIDTEYGRVVRTRIGHEVKPFQGWVVLGLGYTEPSKVVKKIDVRAQLMKVQQKMEAEAAEAKKNQSNTSHKREKQKEVCVNDRNTMYKGTLVEHLPSDLSKDTACECRKACELYDATGYSWMQGPGSCKCWAVISNSTTSYGVQSGLCQATYYYIDPQKSDDNCPQQDRINNLLECGAAFDYLKLRQGKAFTGNDDDLIGGCAFNAKDENMIFNTNLDATPDKDDQGMASLAPVCKAFGCLDLANGTNECKFCRDGFVLEDGKCQETCARFHCEAPYVRHNLNSQEMNETKCCINVGDWLSMSKVAFLTEAFLYQYDGAREWWSDTQKTTLLLTNLDSRGSLTQNYLNNGIALYANSIILEILRIFSYPIGVQLNEWNNAGGIALMLISVLVTLLHFVCSILVCSILDFMTDTDDGVAGHGIPWCSFPVQCFIMVSLLMWLLPVKSLLEPNNKNFIDMASSFCASLGKTFIIARLSLVDITSVRNFLMFDTCVNVLFPIVAVFAGGYSEDKAQVKDATEKEQSCIKSARVRENACCFKIASRYTDVDYDATAYTYPERKLVTFFLQMLLSVLVLIGVWTKIAHSRLNLQIVIVCAVGAFLCRQNVANTFDGTSFALLLFSEYKKCDPGSGNNKSDFRASKQADQGTFDGVDPEYELPWEYRSLETPIFGKQIPCISFQLRCFWFICDLLVNGVFSVVLISLTPFYLASVDDMIGFATGAFALTWTLSLDDIPKPYYVRCRKIQRPINDCQGQTYSALGCGDDDARTEHLELAEKEVQKALKKFRDGENEVWLKSERRWRLSGKDPIVAKDPIDEMDEIYEEHLSAVAREEEKAMTKETRKEKLKEHYAKTSPQYRSGLIRINERKYIEEKKDIERMQKILSLNEEAGTRTNAAYTNMINEALKKDWPQQTQPAQPSSA